MARHSLKRFAMPFLQASLVKQIYGPSFVKALCDAFFAGFAC